MVNIVIWVLSVICAVILTVIVGGIAYMAADFCHTVITNRAGSMNQAVWTAFCAALLIVFTLAAHKHIAPLAEHLPGLHL